VALNFKVQS